MDRRYLSSLADSFGGVDLLVWKRLAAVLAEQRDMLEEVIEPYLYAVRSFDAHTSRAMSVFVWMGLFRA